MSSGSPASAPDEAAVLHAWSARRLRPIIVVYVALIFLAMMALAHFVVRSPAAVKALALGAVGFIVPLMPAVISRVEYRLTETGLEQRPRNVKSPREFAPVFTWAELDRVAPSGSGFKFALRLDEPRRWRRFWKLHVSDSHSGEIHVEPADRARVREILADRGVPTGGP